MRNIALSLLILFFIISGSFQFVGTKEYKIRKIVIDPGHGGRDPGTHGAISKEKDVVLKIALALKRVMNENMPEVKVVLTRENDSFPALEDRPKMAN